MIAVAQQVRLVLGRELRLEGAGREAALSAVPFAATVLVLVGLGLDRRADLVASLAPTLTWLVVLTSVLPLARLVAGVEHDDGTWDTIRVIRPVSLMAGKALSLWIALAGLWGLTALLSVVLLGASWTEPAVTAGVLGSLGLALNATALGVVLGQGTRRPGLLATLVLPAGIPVLLAGTRVADGVAPGAWLTLLTVYDAVLVTVLWALTPVLMEE